MQPNDDICHYYHLHDMKLGEGGFAKVRLATHLATKYQVAIKCLDKVKLGPELPRIYNEIECLKRLKHKNIARLYQVFETETVIYLVLEYCAGGELFDYIVKKTKLDEPESAQIIYDLMRVLDFIHENGFAHRDLKPENVLFDGTHQIKLIDFGLTANCSTDHMAANKNQAPIDQLSTCCGSVTYAAPEVISGSRYSGTAVDVWSTGVMMYALLVGQLPFNDNSISKLYQKIQAGIQNLPPFLSKDACDLIKRMLTVDPKQRITVREVLAHPWLRIRTINSTRINRRLDFNSGQLDEQTVKKCNDLFPHLSDSELRNYIMTDFNYYSTAYHLLHAKVPPRSYGVKRYSPSTNATNPVDSRPPIRAVQPNTIHVSPVKKTRYITVTNTPRTPRTPPSYLKHIKPVAANGSHFSATTPRRRPPMNEYNNNIRMATVFTSKRTPKKSIVKRILDSVTPSKLKHSRKKLRYDEHIKR